MNNFVPPKVEIHENTRIYLNENNEEIAWFLIEDGKMTQARFYLSDPDPQVCKKMLCWNNGHYCTDIWQLQYNKVFIRGEAQVREYYSNDEMWMYSETIDSGNWRFIRYCSAGGGIISMEIDIQLATGEYRSIFVMVQEEHGWRTHHTVVEEEGCYWMD